MTKYRKILEADFEAETLNASSTSFPADTGDCRNGSSMMADVVSYGGSQQLCVYDSSNIYCIRRLRTLSFNYPVGAKFFVDLYALQSSYGYSYGCYLQFDFWEGSSLRISLRIDMNSGLIYYETSSTYTSSGVSITIGSTTHLGILLVSATTFEISVNNGSTWSSALNTQATISAYINKLGIQTPNLDGIENETFESYTDGSTLTSQGSWIANGSAASGTCHLESSNKEGRWTNTGSGNTGNEWTLPSGWTNATWNTLYCRAKTSDATKIFTIIYLQNPSALGSPLTFDSGGYIRVGSNNIITYSANTWYWFRFHVRVSDLACWVEISTDGINYTTYNNSGSYYTGGTNGTPTVWGTWIGANAVTADIDDMICDWNTTNYSIECYIDNVWGNVPSAGDMQMMQFQQLGTTISHCEYLSDTIDQPGNSIVFGCSDGLYRATYANPTSWTKVISGQENWALTNMGSGTIYAGEIGYAINGAGTLQVSTDYGATWSNCGYTNATTTYLCMIFHISTQLYVITAAQNGSNYPTFTVWKWSAGTYTSQATWTPESTNTAQYATATGYVSGNYYYAIYQVAILTPHLYFAYYDTVNKTFTQVSCTTGYTLALGTDPHVLRSGTNRYTCAVKSADGNFYVLASTDSGSTFNPVQAGWYNFVRDDEIQAGYPTYMFGTIGTYSYIWQYDSTFNHFMLEFQYPTAYSPGPIVTGTGYMLLPLTGSTSNMYYPSLSTVPQILSCIITDGIYTGQGNSKTCTFSVTTVNSGMYIIGSMVQFYDEYGTLAFNGIIRSSSDLNNGMWEYKCTGWEYELGNSYAGTTGTKTWTTKTSANILIDILTNSCNFAYNSSSVTASSTTYTYILGSSGPTSLDIVMRLLRGMENRVLYTTPWGVVYYPSALVSSGVTWKEVTGNAFPTDGLPYKDPQITRTAVVRTGNTRTEVIDNAALETINGRVCAPDYVDMNIQGATEASQLATNLYSMIGKPLYYAHLIVTGEGYMQPGTTVIFSWSTGLKTAFPPTAMMITQFQFDLKADVYSWLELSTGIVAQAEFKNSTLYLDPVLAQN